MDEYARNKLYERLVSLEVRVRRGHISGETHAYVLEQLRLQAIKDGLTDREFEKLATAAYFQPEPNTNGQYCGYECAKRWRIEPSVIERDRIREDGAQ